MDAKCILALIQTDGTDDIKITKRMRWELDQTSGAVVGYSPRGMPLQVPCDCVNIQVCVYSCL